jgi:VWFA-related protein
MPQKIHQDWGAVSKGCFKGIIFARLLRPRLSTLRLQEQAITDRPAILAPRKPMPLQPTIRQIFGLLLALLLCSGPTPVAHADNNMTATFGDVLDVRLVNVEVWVTDSKGNPVRGLGAADFKILEDDHPMVITHFAEGHSDEHSDEHSDISPAAPKMKESSSLEAAESTVLIPENPGIPQGYLVLYFDQLNMRPGGRRRLIQDLRQFIASNQIPAERILLLRQQWDLYTEAPFGSSADEVDAALTRLASTTTLGGQAANDKRFQIQKIQGFWEDTQLGFYSDDPCEWFIKRSYEVIDTAARQTRDQISTSLGHLAHTVGFLAGLPGPKTLLYLSDALESNPGTGFLTFVHQLCPNSQQAGPRFAITEGLIDSLQLLTRRANANRVTLYTLQTLGLRTSFLGSVDQANIEAGSGATFEAALRSSERSGLSFLATETGGRAVFNRNRFGAEFSKIATEMSNYYSLAYAPTHGGDGQEHRIKVRVLGKGWRIRHRLSYRDKGDEEHLADQLKSALYLGVTNNPHGLRLGQGKAQAENSGGYIVPLHILVSPERITFVPGKNGPTARISLQVDTRSEKNRRLTSVEKAFHAAPPPEGSKQLLDLAIDLKLRPGTYAVAVALRDEASKETSVLATTLAIQP